MHTRNLFLSGVPSLLNANTIRHSVVTAASREISADDPRPPAGPQTRSRAPAIPAVSLFLFGLGTCDIQ